MYYVVKHQWYTPNPNNWINTNNCTVAVWWRMIHGIAPVLICSYGAPLPRDTQLKYYRPEASFIFRSKDKDEAVGYALMESL